MANGTQDDQPWFTAEEIALACGCAPDAVEALARSNHWPRVHGGEGAKYGVDLDAVRTALAGNPATVHGSIPPSA